MFTRSRYLMRRSVVQGSEGKAITWINHNKNDLLLGSLEHSLRSCLILKLFT